jgi:hypothetical protein
MGLSPEQVAMVTNHPDLFAGDFPSGAREALKSIVFQVYPVAERMGLDLTAVWGVMISLEIVAFAAAVIWATKRLFPGTSMVIAATAAVVFTAGSLITPDLARFKFPHFGWVYGFAHAGALVVVAETIRSRYVAASVFLTATFMIHPIAAALAGAFSLAATAVKLFDYRNLQVRSILIAGIIAAVGCSAWLGWLSSEGNITGQGVDTRTFVAFVRAHNFHWFPSYMGVYWENHHAHLLPLLSTLALIAWALGRQPPEDLGVVRQVSAGILAMMVLCVIGLINAELAQSPFLIKLALHRADTLALLVGGIVIVRALAYDLVSNDPIERALAGYLLILPLVAPLGLAPLPVALRVAYAALKAGRPTEWRLSLGLAVSIVVLIVFLIVFYGLNELIDPVNQAAYTGIPQQNAVALALAGAAAALWPHVAPMSRRIPVGHMLFLAIVALSVFNADKVRTFNSSNLVARGENALAAQLWARKNTPEASLFMIDPGLYYMWRDKSHRPSFGTPSEWLFISLMYNTQADIFEEGLRRYNALGLETPSYVYNPPSRRMVPQLERLVGDAVESYYALSATALRQLADEFGIDYFVFRTEMVPDGAPLGEVYRNAHFVIAQAQ